MVPSTKYSISPAQLEMKLNNQRFQNLVIDRNGSHQVQPNSGYGQSQNRQYNIQNHDNRLTTTNNNSNTTTSTNQHTKIAKTASNTSTDSANSSNSVNSTNSINSTTTGNNKDLSACPGF